MEEEEKIQRTPTGKTCGWAEPKKEPEITKEPELVAEQPTAEIKQPNQPIESANNAVTTEQPQAEPLSVERELADNGLVAEEFVPRQYDDFSARRAQVNEEYKWNPENSNLAQYYRTHTKPKPLNEKRLKYGKVAAVVSDALLAVADLIGAHNGNVARRNTSSYATFVKGVGAEREKKRQEELLYSKGETSAMDADMKEFLANEKARRSAIAKLDAEEAKDKRDVDNYNARGRQRVASANAKTLNAYKGGLAKANDKHQKDKEKIVLRGKYRRNGKSSSGGTKKPTQAQLINDEAIAVGANTHAVTDARTGKTRELSANEKKANIAAVKDGKPQPYGTPTKIITGIQTKNNEKAARKLN